MLLLAANPRDSDRLGLDEEARAIDQALRSARQAREVALRTCWAVRPDDVLSALSEDAPRVVHFCGHGAQEGILLQDDSGLTAPVPADTLRALFGEFRAHVRLVFLNACLSEAQAQAITQEIDCAIGMRSFVDDGAARRFAATFYRAVAHGHSVQDAFDQGVIALRLEQSDDHDEPQLLTRAGVDAAQIILLPGRADPEPVPEPTVPPGAGRWPGALRRRWPLLLGGLGAGIALIVVLPMTCSKPTPPRAAPPPAALAATARVPDAALAQVAAPAPDAAPTPAGSYFIRLADKAWRTISRAQRVTQPDLRPHPGSSVDEACRPYRYCLRLEPHGVFPLGSSGLFLGSGAPPADLQGRVDPARAGVGPPPRVEVDIDTLPPAAVLRLDTKTNTYRVCAGGLLFAGRQPAGSGADRAPAVEVWDVDCPRLEAAPR